MCSAWGHSCMFEKIWSMDSNKLSPNPEVVTYVFIISTLKPMC